MKKIFAIVSIFSLIWVSCDVLDVNPQHSIPEDQAINSRNDALRAITGCYDALQAVGYYGRNYIVVGDLAADNLIWSGTTAGYNQIDNNSILADNTIVEGIWADIYRLLNRVNNLIVRLPDLDDISEGERNEMLAEMYFLRALAHFDLVRLFGAVPIRTQPVTINEDDLNIPRSPADDVYQQVFDDILLAEQNMNASGSFVSAKASYPAVLALKAKVNLYYYSITNNKSYLDTAIEAASNVINDFGFSLENDFAFLFSGNNNSETIFEVDFNEQDRNRMAEYFFPTNLSGRHEFTPHKLLYNAFIENDARKDASIGINQADTFALKYNDIETGTDNVYVFRLSEMYLIRAEARALKQTDVEGIQDDINTVRGRAGLNPVTTNDFTALLQHIGEQRRLEFAFEGHRWFDLVRTGRAVEVLEGVTQDYQTLFPIPLNEILANDAITNDDQNPGY